jgi:hypothetical protein
MTDIPQTDLTPAERVDDIPRTLRALRQAVQEALQRHKRDGHAVALWRNDRVEWIQPEDIPVQSESPGSE